MTRVLFVDDEPALLRAFERNLRTKARWHTRFVGSGADALDLLERETIDVIVSDIGMPMMDGMTLLGNVRARHPQIARLALSGEFAQPDDVRAAVVVQQWIAKPCSLPQLCAVIERVTWARSLVADPQLVAAVTGLASLPSMPALHARVSQALSLGTVTPDVIALLEHDPAIAGKLLQLVNSSFYGVGKPTTSVQRAAGLVGVESLTHLLRSAEVFRPDPSVGQLVADSQTVAALARGLASREQAGDAFLAGLLHGVGKLAITALAMPAHPSPILHARLGGLLLGTWGLPANIVTAVAFHRDPHAAPDPTDVLLRLIALTTQLAAGECATAVDHNAIALALDPALCRALAARVCGGDSPYEVAS